VSGIGGEFSGGFVWSKCPGMSAGENVGVGNVRNKCQDPPAGLQVSKCTDRLFAIVANTQRYRRTQGDRQIVFDPLYY